VIKLVQVAPASNKGCVKSRPSSNLLFTLMGDGKHTCRSKRNTETTCEAMATHDVEGS